MQFSRVRVEEHAGALPLAEGPPRKPRSIITQSTIAVGLISLLIAIPVVRLVRPFSVDAVIALLAAMAVPMLAFDGWRERAKLFGVWRRPSLARVATKVAGLVTTLAIIGVLYWVLPLYRGEQGALVSSLLRVLAIPFAILAPVYVWVTDGFMSEPHDALYSAGLVITGGWRTADLSSLVDYSRAWIVKGFFLPLMLLFVHNDVVWLYKLTSESIFHTPFGWYLTIYRLIFLVDVIVGCTGYLCTFRLFGSHIQSTNPFASGWVVCLICYYPFNTLLSNYFTVYYEKPWSYWMGNYWLLGQLWALLILLVVAFHEWSNISFGYRFSNLTNRGILTDGPYRYFKHPAYLSKCLLWWLLYLPFFTLGTGWDALRHCLLLGLANLIYFLRAKTEEQHLWADETYRAYSNYIDEFGAVAKLRKTVRRQLSFLIPGNTAG